MKMGRCSLWAIVLIAMAMSCGSAVPTCRSCTCGTGGRRGGRVVGGAVTGRGELPLLAAIVKDGEVHCGATLITASYVMTAAHCLDGIDLSTIGVVVGAYNVSGDEVVVREVTRAHQHPDFDRRTFDSDIALLRLKEPLPADLVRPACLPVDHMGNGEPLEGRAAVVAGWGRTSERGPLSDVPRKVTVRVWTEEQCLSAGYGSKKITARMLCAGLQDGGRDACRGDSGGPLLVSGLSGELKIVGVVSWGRGCARPSFPGIYARVDRFLPWIRAQLRGECLCSAPPPPLAYLRARG